MKQSLLDRADLFEAQRAFESACAFSRAHSELAARALRQHGSHGPLISGCVRDHFPDSIKESLRELARAVTRYSDQGYAARPRRVRISTMRALARAVAARDGSGFYGPQA